MTTAVCADVDARCWRCGRKLGALLTRPWKLRCQRCNAENNSPPASTTR